MRSLAGNAGKARGSGLGQFPFGKLLFGKLKGQAGFEGQIEFRSQAGFNQSRFSQSRVESQVRFRCRMSVCQMSVRGTLLHRSVRFLVGPRGRHALL